MSKKSYKTLPNLVNLRVKRKALADEARTIHAEEEFFLAKGRKQRLGNEDYNPAYIQYESLRKHRIETVRRVSRAMGLAHRYLLNKPYAPAEGEMTPARLSRMGAARYTALCEAIAKEVRTFCEPGDDLNTSVNWKHIDDWLNYGKPTVKQMEAARVAALEAASEPEDAHLEGASA